MSAVKKVDRGAGLLSTATTALATLAVLWLIGVTVVHVVLRATGHGGVSGIVESSALVMVGVIFLGFAGAQRAGAHVSVQLFVRMLPARVQNLLALVSLVVGIVFVVWMVWATYDAFSTSFDSGERLSGVVRIPIWPARAVVVFGFASLLVELLNSVLQTLFSPKDAPRTAAVDNVAGQDGHAD